MKSFACGEVVPDCPAVFSGPDYEAVLHQVADHARTVHHLPELPPEVTHVLRQAWQRPDDWQQRPDDRQQHPDDRSDDAEPGRR